MSSQIMQKCENCWKSYPQTKINSHFSYCKRNIKMCTICREMYDINYQEDHQKQFHSKQTCTYCKAQFPSKNINQHKASCTSKPKICQFCQQQVPKHLYNPHVEQCGARTQLCPICNKNILLKDHDKHFNACYQTQLPKQSNNNITNNLNQQNQPVTNHSNIREANHPLSPQQPFETFIPRGITSVPQRIHDLNNRYQNNDPYSNRMQETRQQQQSVIQTQQPQIQHLQHQIHPYMHQNRVLNNRILPQRPQYQTQHNLPTNVSSRQQQYQQHSPIYNNQYQQTQTQTQNQVRQQFLRQPQIRPQPPRQISAQIVPQHPNSRPQNQTSFQDEQSEMIQRAMMESLQTNRRQPPKQPHQNSEIKFSAQSLMDKSLLEDIEMQQQILNSMKKNNSYGQNSQLRSHNGQRRW